MGHQGFASRTLTKRGHVLVHKNKGLCIRCSRKTTPGRVLCQYHLNYDKKQKRKYRQLKYRSLF